MSKIFLDHKSSLAKWSFSCGKKEHHATEPQETDVTAGDAQRRPGLHLETPGEVLWMNWLVILSLTIEI